MRIFLDRLREGDEKKNLSPEERVLCLQNLEELAEEVDNANDLDKLGGINYVVQNCCPSEYGPERAAAASILACVARNNPAGQAAVGRCGGLQWMVKELREERFGPAMLKVFSAGEARGRAVIFMRAYFIFNFSFSQFLLLFNITMLLFCNLLVKVVRPLLLGLCALSRRRIVFVNVAFFWYQSCCLRGMR